MWLRRLLDLINQTIAVQPRIRDSSTAVAGIFNHPALGSPNKFHAGPLSPPTIHLARSGYPYRMALSQPGDVLQQLLVYRPRPGFLHIVRVDDEAHQAKLLADDRRLLSPDACGVVAEDMEERIVLNRSDRNLENIANEIGHHRTAAAALRIEMGHVWNRHIVGKFQLVVPELLSIKNSRAKSICFELRAI